MVDRIKLVMDYEGMTSAHFADYIEIGRAVMSHILNGRNKPSLEVITKILSKIDYIDPNWLLTGEGTMLKQELPANPPLPTPKQLPYQQDLFSGDKPQESEIMQPKTQQIEIHSKENELRTQNTVDNTIVNQSIELQKIMDKKITKIIIYYSDNTFETFNPEKIESKSK